MANPPQKLASTLNRHEKNRTIRSKIKRYVPKPVLCQPYDITWPQIDSKSQEQVLSYLTKFFQDNKLSYDKPDKSSLKNLSKAEKKVKLKDHALKNKSSEISSLRQQLVLGIGEATRNMENKSLSLLIVDKSTPWQLHRHLIKMSRIRDCPAMAISQLSETVSPLLSLTKICAFGVKTFKDGDSTLFLPLVDHLKTFCIPCDIPWFETEQELMSIKNGTINHANKSPDDDDDDEKEHSSSESSIDENISQDDDDSKASMSDMLHVVKKTCDEDESNDDDDDDVDMSSNNKEDISYLDLYVINKDGNVPLPEMETVIVNRDEFMFDYKTLRTACDVEKPASIGDHSEQKWDGGNPNESLKRKFCEANVSKLQKNEFKKKKPNP